MAKKQKNNSKPTYNSQQSRKPKPIILNLSIAVESTGYPTPANDTDALFNKLYYTLKHFEDEGIFNMISLTVGMDRGYLTEGWKGTIQAARIISFDENNSTVSLLFFGRNIDCGNLILNDLNNGNDWLVSAKMLENRSGSSTILGFNFVRYESTDSEEDDSEEEEYE